LTIASPAQKGKHAQSPFTLQKIVPELTQFMTNHHLPNPPKNALLRILDMAKKGYVEGERDRTYVPMIAVKALHEQFKADLVFVQQALETKLSDIQSDQKKLLTSTVSLNK